MQRLLMAMLIGATGCASSVSAPNSPDLPVGPVAQDQEVALELVWEGIYGMERESRPPLTWFTGCVPDRLHVVVTPECWTGQATPAGGVELLWTGSTISATDFTKELDSWRGYLLNGKFVPWDLTLINRAQTALDSAGL